MLKSLRRIDPSLMAIEFALLAGYSLFCLLAAVFMTPYFLLKGQWKRAAGGVLSVVSPPFLVGDWLISSLLERPGYFEGLWSDNDTN